MMDNRWKFFRKNFLYSTLFCLFTTQFAINTLAVSSDIHNQSGNLEEISANQEPIPDTSVSKVETSNDETRSTLNQTGSDRMLLAQIIDKQGGGSAATRGSYSQQNDEAYARSILAQFQDDDADNYRLRKGDVIFVDIWTNPELSGAHTIGPDGKITLPVSGPVRIDGLTRESAAKKVVDTLSPNYPNITATVRVDQYSIHKISILGHVMNPGIHGFKDRPTLLEAITSAGGLIREDILPSGQQTPKPFKRQCAIIRGQTQLAVFDLNPLMRGENLELNVLLRSDDVVQIPDIDDPPLYIFGQVVKAGFYNLAPKMTLLDAIAQAGGLTRDASMRRVKLIRPDAQTRAKINLKELMKPEAYLDVELQVGDIIYVPPNWIAEVGYVMRNLSPLNAFLLSTN